MSKLAALVEKIREIVEVYAPELLPDGDDPWGIRKYTIVATDAEWRDLYALLTEPSEADEPPWPGWFSCCDCHGWFKGPPPVAYISGDEVCRGCAERRDQKERTIDGGYEAAVTVLEERLVRHYQGEGFSRAALLDAFVAAQHALGPVPRVVLDQRDDGTPILYIGGDGTTRSGECFYLDGLPYERARELWEALNK